MKKVTTFLVVGISAALFLTSCQKDMKKELIKEKEKSSISSDDHLAKENFVPLQKCVTTPPKGEIAPPQDAYFSNGDTSRYPMDFFVTAGTADICIPKVVKFIPGADDYTAPAVNMTDFAVTFVIKDNLGHYLSGSGSGDGYLAPGAYGATIEQMDLNSEKTFTGFKISTGKTAHFRVTGRINELLSNPAAVIDGYQFGLWGCPIKLRPTAPTNQWTFLNFSTMNYNLSSGTPPPLYQ